MTASPIKEPGAAEQAVIAEEAAAVSASRQLRDRSLVHGVAWNGVVKLVSQAAVWGSTIVVAHYLSPDAYGLVGMATFFLGFMEMVTEFGIGTTIAIRRELSDRQIQELNSVSVMMGVTGTLLLCAAAPLLGAFFHDGRLPKVVVFLSTTFLFKSFRSVPWGLLQRDLRFKRLALYDGAQALILAGLSVTLAALGFDYWTLVAASIASAAITSVFAMLAHPVAFRRPDFRELSPQLSFSGQLVGQRLAWYGYSNADFLVAGKMLGSGPLGNYTLAWTLSRVTDKATALLLQVTPPILAKVQDDLGEMRRYVIRITEALSVGVLPLMIGLALVARDFVPVVLGAKWHDMIFPLQVLSAYAGVGVVLPLLGQVLNVTGHVGYAMRNNFLQVAVMPVLFVIGAHFGGINGIAIAWILGHPLLGLRITRHTLRVIGLSGSQYFREALAPAVVGCSVMALAVFAVRISWSAAAPSLARLIVEIVVGGAAFVITLLLFYRSRIREIVGFVRQIM